MKTLNVLCLRRWTVSAKALLTYLLITFSGCPSAAFIRSFDRTDLVTTISHERLEQF